MLCYECGAKIPTLESRLRRVNAELYQLGLEYHDTLSYSLNAADRILLKHGFQETYRDTTPPVILTGLEGKQHSDVGEGKYLTLAWHRMESGRYEVVAYVN